MEHEEGTYEKACDCPTMIAAVVATPTDTACWCLWCGIGWGDAALMLLRAGQPMEDVLYLDVTVPTFPLIGKVAA
jgi:hypothetical protein